MYFELKENKPHGTKDDPFSTYHIKNEGRSFQIPVHWHDELEIIYVKSGFLTVSISGENYIGTPGDAFVVSPGNLHFMGSQAGEVDYFTFLFPLEYISFCTDDMLDDKLLTPLKNGHLMIRPRIKDAAKELCEQLTEIYMAKNDEKKLEIAVQIKTKIILLQFILHMWENGFIIENDKSGRNTVEKEMISYIQQSFTGEISLKEFGEQFHLSEKYVSKYFKEHFHITLSKYVTYLRLEHREQWDLSGDIIDCFRRYSSELSPEEQEEIIKGIEEGLTDQDVKRYFTLVGAEKMRQYRRVLIARKKKG